MKKDSWDHTLKVSVCRAIQKGTQHESGLISPELSLEVRERTSVTAHAPPLPPFLIVVRSHPEEDREGNVTSL